MSSYPYKVTLHHRANQRESPANVNRVSPGLGFRSARDFGTARRDLKFVMLRRLSGPSCNPAMLKCVPSSGTTCRAFAPTWDSPAPSCRTRRRLCISALFRCTLHFRFCSVGHGCSSYFGSHRLYTTPPLPSPRFHFVALPAPINCRKFDFSHFGEGWWPCGVWPITRGRTGLRSAGLPNMTRRSRHCAIDMLECCWRT